MKTFDLVRTEDVSGVSGIGTVAQGVEFDDGSCVLRWLTEFKSTAFYNSVRDLLHIHEHGGRTKVVFHEEIK
jgi:hypothetical protein